MNILKSIDYSYFSEHPMKDEMKLGIKRAVGLKAKVANAYCHGDIVSLANILADISAKSVIIKKASTTSPVYTSSQKPAHMLKLAGIIETALFLLVNDEETNSEAIDKAYEVLVKSKYTFNDKLSEAFHCRIKADINYNKTLEVINKLQILGEELGFSH